MVSENKIFELMTQMYSEFKGFKDEMLGFKGEMSGFKGEMSGFKGEMSGFKGEILDFKGKMLDFKEEITGKVDNINKTVIKIENEHGDKLSALFDGWKQNTEKLDRIENKVSRQDEVILRKIK